MRPAARAAAPSALGRDAFTARAFTTDAADLDAAVDAARPVASTDTLLMSCLRDAAGRSPNSGEVRRWTVARRLDALIAIRAAAGGKTERIALRCSEPTCRESFEAELDLAACRSAGEASVVEFALDGATVRARLPTGADQARWQEDRMPLHLVAASLLEAPAPQGADVVAALDAALARIDPARELQLELTCPGCATTQPHAVDLEAQLLAAFAQEQGLWLRRIARLARSFHWAEAEIARMPAWRRDFYLGWLDAAELGEEAG